MKFLIGFLLNGLLFLLSWIVPKTPGTLLCGGGMGRSFSGNPKYFLLFLLRLERQDGSPFRSYCWITKDPKTFRSLKQQQIPVVYAYSLRGFWSILRSETLMIENWPAGGVFGHDIAYQRLFFGNFTILQTWHGSPLKQILLDALKRKGRQSLLHRIYYHLEKAELHRLWKILAMGRREQTILSRATGNPNVIITGYPKNDILIEGLEAWGFSREWSRHKRVILYAPTFRDTPGEHRAFSAETLAKLDRMLDDRGWILLVKKHPYDRTLHIDSSLEHIIDVTGRYDDIQLLLAQSDLLITDYSSVFVDFLLTGRPIVFYPYDLDEYLEKSREFYYDLFDNPPGELCRTEEQLFAALERDPFGNGRYTEAYHKALETFHLYRDAASCRRVMDLLIARNELSDTPSPRSDNVRHSS